MSREKIDKPETTTTLPDETLGKVSGGTNRAVRGYSGKSPAGSRLVSDVEIDMPLQQSSPMLEECALNDNKIAEVDLNIYGNSDQRKKKR